jgi:hypothetical protein
MTLFTCVEQWSVTCLISAGVLTIIAHMAKNILMIQALSLNAVLVDP